MISQPPVIREESLAPPPGLVQDRVVRKVCRLRLKIRAAEKIGKAWVRAQRIEHWVRFYESDTYDRAIFISLFQPFEGPFLDLKTRIDFRPPHRRSRVSTPEARRNWRDSIYEQIREVMLLQGSLSIERMCQLVPISRRSFYRSLKEQQPADEELEVRSAIQQMALEHRRRYGYRRITAELHRRVMQINHQRVVRIMREDNLLPNGD
jgi:hypothetical protein